MSRDDEEYTEEYKKEMKELDLQDFVKHGVYGIQAGDIELYTYYEKDAHKQNAKAEKTPYEVRLKRYNKKSREDAKEFKADWGDIDEFITKKLAENAHYNAELEAELAKQEEKARKRDERIERLEIEGKTPEFILTVRAGNLREQKGFPTAMAEAKKWIKAVRDELVATGKYDQWGVADVIESSSAHTDEPDLNEDLITFHFTTKTGVKPREYAADLEVAIKNVEAKFKQSHVEKLQQRGTKANSIAFERVSALLDPYKDQIPTETLASLRKAMIADYTEILGTPRSAIFKSNQNSR